MQTRGTEVARSRLAVAAGVVGLVVDLGYVAIMVDEPERLSGRFAVVFLFILAVSTLAIAAGVAISRSPRTRIFWLGAATGGLLTAGVVGIFSIGLPLLIAGSMCAAAWAGLLRAVRPVPTGVPLLSMGAAIASGAILILGIAIS